MTWKEPETRANVAGWVSNAGFPSTAPPTAQRDMAILDALHVAYKTLQMSPSMAKLDAHAKALTKLQLASSLLKAQPFEGLEEGSTSLPF